MKATRAILALSVTVVCVAPPLGAQTAPAVPRAVGHSRAGSAVALATLGDRTLALVADADDRRLHAFDIDRGAETWVLPLDGTPGQLVVTRHGTLLVALRDKNHVRAFSLTEADTPPSACASFDTPSDPVGLALTPNETDVAVVSAWGRALVVHALSDFSRKLSVTLAREPRAVVVSKSGTRAFVTHAASDVLSVVGIAGATGQVTTLPIAPAAAEPPTLRVSALGRASRLVAATATPIGRALSLAEAEVEGKVLVPAVALDTGRPVGAGYYGASIVAFGMIEVDEETLAVTRRTPAKEPCFLPLAALHDGGTTYVACTDRDYVLQANGNSIPATGVSALAFDERNHALVGWSQLTRTLTVTPPSGTGLPRAWRASGPSRLNEEERLGRAVFYASDRRISGDGRACATCHPDGRDDGLTWSTPDGPRQTAMLAGRLMGTAPYGWTRDEPNLASYVRGTVQRLGGSGLGERDLAAVARYIASLPAPTPSLQEAERLARGRQIFAANCASCHLGPSYTDGKRHAIGSAAANDREPAFATPSLRFVDGTPPYFHDGRYPTLRELLVATDGTMGPSKHLAEPDLDALEAFVRTL